MCFRYLLEVVGHQFVERDVFSDFVVRKTLLVVEFWNLLGNFLSTSGMVTHSFVFL